jgi:hypothetical protein
LPVNGYVKLRPRSNKKDVCMIARKNECSIECPLDGTPRATLRGLLEDCGTSKDSSTRQYRMNIRVERDPGQYRMTEEDRH